jgi:hypothetical protein
MTARARFIIAVVIVGVAGATSPLLAGPRSVQPHRIDIQHSTITVHVFKSGLLRAFADNHVIQAPPSDGWVDDSGTVGADITFDARQLRVLDPGASSADREQVQARMLGPEVLDATRFPQIRFQSTGVQQLGIDRWSVRGSVELHGRVHDATVEVVREHGHYRGQTKLRQTDFGITPVSVAGGAVKVKDELVIDFDIVIKDR